MSPYFLSTLILISPISLKIPSRIASVGSNFARLRRKLYDFNSYIDLLYFTEIILINNNIKNFRNNIKSYKINNPYNYQVFITYNDKGNIIYPSYSFIKQNTYYTYGLKTEII